MIVVYFAASHIVTMGLRTSFRSRCVAAVVV